MLGEPSWVLRKLHPTGPHHLIVRVAVKFFLVCLLAELFLFSNAESSTHCDPSLWTGPRARFSYQQNGHWLKVLDQDRDSPIGRVRLLPQVGMQWELLNADPLFRNFQKWKALHGWQRPQLRPAIERLRSIPGRKKLQIFYGEPRNVFVSADNKVLILRTSISFLIVSLENGALLDWIEVKLPESVDPDFEGRAHDLLELYLTYLYES
jgi:hypothetical protein